MNKWKCEYCVYYEHFYNGSGFCHRYPPKGGDFPVVGKNVYCGEWKESPKGPSTDVKRWLEKND